MGFIDDVAAAVRKALSGDKEHAPSKLAAGATPNVGGGAAFDVLAAYGQEALSSYLSLENDMLSRFADYEYMDDYPLTNCLAGETPVYTLEWGWRCISDLPAEGSFHVLAYDANLRSLVPAQATAFRSLGAGHTRPMVRVWLDNGESILCTEDHRFLTKDEEWVEAGKLRTDQRLMPGYVRLAQLAAGGCYYQVHQPHDDSCVKSSDGKRWVHVHRLVGEYVHGAGFGDVVHHIDENKLNNAPANLSVETHTSHAKLHPRDNTQSLPPWTPERREAMAVRMRGNTYRRGASASDETRARMSAAHKGKRKSREWADKIGAAQRITLPREAVEAAVRQGTTTADVARYLGVSWRVASREIRRHDLRIDSTNHRVLRVERVTGHPDVYDLTVPGFANFVAAGVVVHNSGLDIYADDATQIDVDKGRSIWIESPDREVERLLDQSLLVDRLRIEEEIWEIARTACKYGNNYEELLVTGEGVIGLNHLPPATVRRVEAERSELLGFVQDSSNRTGFTPEQFRYLLARRGGEALDTDTQQIRGTAFEDWEVVHFRLRGKQRKSAYGWSVLDGARWIWKRLVLLEDSSLIFRLQKAQERHVFYVDVGNMPAPQALAYLNQVRQGYRKRRYVNPTTGQLDLSINVLSPDDDIFIPTRAGNDGTKIETMSAPAWQHMDDLEYFLRHLFTAMKIPKAYMSQEEGVARAVLSSQDVRFARTILRVQRELRTGVAKIARVDLAAKNINPEAVDYDVRMTVPSSIFELAQMEVRNARADLAERMKGFVSIYWILQSIFGFRDDEIQTIIDQRAEDMKRDAAAQGGGGGGFESVSPRRPLLTEADLFRGGNKEDEKRLLEAIRGGKEGHEIRTRLRDVQDLLRELVYARRGVR